MGVGNYGADGGQVLVGHALRTMMFEIGAYVVELFEFIRR
jgi:hypothetical protein